MIKQRLHFLQADLILDIDAVDANMEEQEIHDQFQEWQRRFEDSLFTIIRNTAVPQEVFVCRSQVGQQEVYQIINPTIFTPINLTSRGMTRGHIYMAKRLRLWRFEIFLLPPRDQEELVAIKASNTQFFFVFVFMKYPSNTSTLHNLNLSV
jgi:hypothetical protein